MQRLRLFCGADFMLCVMFEWNQKYADEAEKLWKWKQNKKPIAYGMQTQFRIIFADTL